MKFTESELGGVFLIEPQPHEDERGYLARTFCAEEFADHGIVFQTAQCNISGNHQRGTLRGMHCQAPPYEEGKLIRCVSGAIYDVILDIRRDSPTFGKWQAFELSAENNAAVYAPGGVAHGYQTLTDDAVVYYQMSEAYHPGSLAGARWNDPAFGIKWPLPVAVISERDAAFPDFKIHQASGKEL